jgi:hypothetical protein
MITAHKYLNLDLSVINISSLIIDKLKKNNLLKYDELLGIIVSILGEKSKEVFPYALNFLFLLNKISYFSELDTFELNETK